MVSSSKPSTRNKRTEWSTARDRILVKILLDLKRSGKWCETGPTRDSWRVIVDQLNEKVPSVPTTREQIRNHLFELKRSFRTVRAMRESDGFQWNDSLQQVLANESTWEEYINTHKGAKRFMRTSFPLYDAMDELYGGILSNGGGQSISNELVDQKEDNLPLVPSQPLLGDDMNEISFSSDRADVNQTGTLLESTPIPLLQNQEDVDQNKRPSETSSSVRTKRSRASIDDRLADEHSRLIDVRGMASKPLPSNPHGYEACLDEILSMEEMAIEERIKLSDLLRDRYHRIAFMKFKGADRIAWARAHLN